MSSLSYEQSGVNYDALDAFKRACQKAAATTTSALQQHGLSEPARIRGESAYLIETPDEYLAHVEEGLGTKNLVADAMHVEEYLWRVLFQQYSGETADHRCISFLRFPCWLVPCTAR